MPESYAETEARIKQAIDKLHNCEKPNIAAVAREFQVPATRLRARWNGRQSKQDRSGPNRRLTDDQELALCLYLQRQGRFGAPARFAKITNCANSILRLNHSDPATPPPTVGSRWTLRFLERHPEFRIRKHKTSKQQREESNHPEDILGWFGEYKAVCDEKAIQEGDIYSYDETGFRICFGQDQWTVTLDPKRQSNLASTGNRDVVTACEAVSGDGTALPPMLILPKVLHQQDRHADTSLEDDVLVAVSDTGYADDELDLDWLHHFERYSARRQVGVYRLLLLYACDSRYTKEFISFCDDHKIIPFSFPSNSTHLLQPLDVVFFQPHEHPHAEAVDSVTRTGCSGFNKFEFLAAVASIRRQVLKQSTIASAFRKTGLVPYGPGVVLDRLQKHSAEPRTPSPPPSQRSAPITTPLTSESIKRHAEYLVTTDLPRTDPLFRESLEKFIKGTLAQAQVGALLQEELLKVKAAELASAN